MPLPTKRLLRPVVVLALCAVLTAFAREAARPSVSNADAGTTIAPLTTWQNVLLGRWVAIDTFVRRYSRRHELPARWTMMTYASESVMAPLAKGALPGDRGIGQVGFNAERKARAAGSNPRSRYYEPDLDPDGNIWDPKTNIILSAISYRRIYDMVPQVKTPAQAYAVYTYGPDAVFADGTIRWDAQQRVDRAISFRPLLRDFRRLKTMAATLSPAELRAQVPNADTRAILALERTHRDGEGTYDSLARLYLRKIAGTRYPWVVVIFGRAALDFMDAGQRIYHEDQSALVARLLATLSRQADLFVGEDAELVALYETLVADANARGAP